MSDNTTKAWEIIDSQMATILEKARWLEEAMAGPKVGVTPAMQEVEANLRMAKAKARGAAEVLAIFLGTTADDVALEAMRRAKS